MKTFRFARPNSFVGDKIYLNPVEKSEVIVPYRMTESSPERAPKKANDGFILSHNVSKIGITVAAASKSANRYI